MSRRRLRRLRHDEVRELERRVAGLPVAEADRLLDLAFSEPGIKWLRRNGWLSPVDRVDTVDTAVAA